MLGRDQEDDDVIRPGATAGMVIPGCLVCHICTCLGHLPSPIPLNEGWIWLVWCDQDNWFCFLSCSCCNDQVHQLSPRARYYLPASLSPFWFLDLFFATLVSVPLCPVSIQPGPIYFFPFDPSFPTSVPKFDFSDTATWVTLVVHGITGTVTPLLLALDDCTPWGAPELRPGVCKAQPFPT